MERRGLRGDPAADRAADGLAAGEWQDAATLLAAAAGPVGEAQLTMLVGGTAAHEGLSAWYRAEPASALLHLALAARRWDDWMWFDQTMPHVQPEQRTGDTIESAHRALEHLQFARRSEPDHPLVRVMLAVVVSELRLRGRAPLRDAVRCLDEAEEVSPQSVLVARYRGMLGLHGDGGSPIDDFVEAARAWPDRDPRLAELVSVVWFQWLNGPLDGPSPFTDDAVAEAVKRVNERYGPGVEDASGIVASAVLLFGIARVAPNDGAKRRHVARLRGRVAAWPYAYLRDPVAGFDDLAASRYG